jgi:hypothetical protein
MVSGEIPNIRNLSWMRTMDKYLISLILVRDIWREGIENDTETLASQKTNIIFELL